MDTSSTNAIQAPTRRNVGWVERSETHHPRRRLLFFDGFRMRSTHPTRRSVIMLVIVLAGMHQLAVRARQQMADAGLVGPIFPGAPSLGRIRTVALVARVDIALRQVLDLAAETLESHQRAVLA